jgi:hypothetical protein
MPSSLGSPEARAARFAQERGRALGAAPGGGKDGTVFSLLAPRPHGAGAPSAGATAIKALRRPDFYHREVDVCLRLDERGMGGPVRVRGHSVPLLLAFDEYLLAFEMTLFTRPFVLDSSSASLDIPPVLTAEVVEESHAHWARVFEDRLPKALAIKAAFEGFGICLNDLSLNNIGFEQPRPPSPPAPPGPRRDAHRTDPLRRSAAHFARSEGGG